MDIIRIVEEAGKEMEKDSQALRSRIAKELEIVEGEITTDPFGTLAKIWVTNPRSGEVLVVEISRLLESSPDWITIKCSRCSRPLVTTSTKSKTLRQAVESGLKRAFKLAEIHGEVCIAKKICPLTKRQCGAYCSWWQGEGDCRFLQAIESIRVREED